jgi:hypothetical protein
LSVNEARAWPNGVIGWVVPSQVLRAVALPLAPIAAGS